MELVAYSRLESSYSMNGGLLDCQTFRSNGMFKEGIDLMEYIGVDRYRFSISRARVLPKGRFGPVNQAGINHYDKFINGLLHKGIQPFVKLTNYDVPQELVDRYGAWLSPGIREDFKHYADICFGFFGDRVKYWVTFNEPNVVAVPGYRSGEYPPAHCSGSFGNCTTGDSEREPFIAAHNMILSHAAAVSVYRNKYQKEQGGSIGIVNNAIWFEPFSISLLDKLAVERAQAFYLYRFLDPIIFGKYPTEMHEILGIHHLPAFSNYELEELKSGLDFICINHYNSFYAKDCMFSFCNQGRGCGVTKTEGFAWWTAHQKDGIFIGEPTSVEWLYVYPQGMEKIVTDIKDRYNNVPLFITENGKHEKGNSNTTTEMLLNDVKRVEYMSRYLDSLAMAVRKGADVQGYFSWSLLDNFEWMDGYTIRFGLHHVDYSTLKGTRKLSAAWYRDYISNHKAGRTCT
ncbi:LOW QUALITY PROTEIN: beta-glucosidase 47-like [Jatropha curcas]|uniref:LOW QUALITY PROTEIN: beta-glucosidase 47-like n=1 Tax=Jatropha curcas TaxID=180498 RepID=UPI0009D6FE3D|nr:LOW QUALITY PROTEIN: beta-glucosidase 47-like [Jatropha curcas]